MDMTFAARKCLLSFIVLTVVLALTLIGLDTLNTQQQFQELDTVLSYRRQNSRISKVKVIRNFTGGYDDKLTWKRFLFETTIRGETLKHALYFTTAVYDVRAETVRIEAVESRREAGLVQVHCRLYQSSIDNIPVDVSAEKERKRVWKMNAQVSGVWYDTVRYTCRVPNPDIHYQYAKGSPHRRAGIECRR